MTLNSTPLDPVVQDESKLLGTSLHHGLNFTHRDSRFTVFWQTRPTFDFLRGQNTRKYPVLGLEEISNVTSTSLRDSDLLAALNRRDRDAVHITYAQAYVYSFHKTFGDFNTTIKLTILAVSPPWKRLYFPTTRSSEGL